MATYLQGVTDYIPDYQPFQPDLNFYNNVLQTKQTQYDSNWKAVNNLYAELHNADLTHDQNVQKKDNLLKQIDFNLKRVSGLDLSLEQNVDQATQVFRPFYEDKYLMKDMAWTKNYNNTVSRALNLKNAQDEKTRAQYWDTGVKELTFRKKEFKDATLDETLNMGNVTYTPYVNAMEKYLKIAKDAGISIDIKDVDESGLYFIHEKNGKALTPSLQNLFLSAYANDPALQAIYATQSYVKRKEYVDQNTAKYNNNPIEAEKAYLNEQYKFLQNYTAKKSEENKQTATVTNNKVTDVKNNVESNDSNPYSMSYLESLQKSLTIDQTVADHSEKLDKEINGGGSSTIATTSGVEGLDLNDMELARLRVDAGTSSVLAEQDILGAADIYAYRDYVYEKSANPVGLENLRHQHSLDRINYTHTLKEQEMQLKAGLDRETDRIKQGLADGTMHYDKDKNLIEDDGSSFPLSLGSSSGQYTDEIDKLKDNYDETNKTIKGLTSQYIGNTFVMMKNLIDNPQGSHITQKEVWNALSFLDPNSKEAASRYGTKDGFQMFNKLWNKYQANPDKFVLEFSKTGQVIKLKKFMDNWANKNYGHKMAVQYKGDKSLQGVDDFIFYKQESDKIYKENKTKVVTGLVKAMDAAGIKLKPETKQKLAEQYFKNKVQGGGSESFEKFVNRNINYDATVDASGNSPTGVNLNLNLGKLLSKSQTDELNKILTKERNKWTDKNWAKTPEGKKILSSGKAADNFQNYLNNVALNYVYKNISDAEFKKMLAKDVWKHNNRQKELYQKGWEWAPKGSSRDQESLKQARTQLSQLKYTLKNDNRNIYGPNKQRLRDDIAKAEKTVKFFENKVGADTKKEYQDYQAKLKKSPYKYTEEELKKAKLAYVKKLRPLNIAAVNLYDDQPVGKVTLEQKTGIDLGDIHDLLSESYLKIINKTGPEGLKSFKGYVRTADGRYAIGANEFTAKRVILSNPSYGGFQDFQEIMSDLNRIRFSQDPNKYAVTIAGITKAAVENNSFSPSEAKALLRELQFSAGKDSKTPPFIIARSSIALENQNLSAAVIIPPREILEKTIKDSDGKTDWARIKLIQKHGISFIAPKSQWTSEFMNANELTPVQQILNAGPIKYKHGNKAGEFTLEKVSNVPGVDYRASFVFNQILSDGSIESVTDYIPLQKMGNTVDLARKKLYDDLQAINAYNLETFAAMQRRGDKAAIARVQQFFNTPTYMGYKY